MKLTLKVLLIEDNEQEAILILKELRTLEMKIEHKRVDKLSELANALDEKWDIILSDFHLIEFDGEKVLRMVREAGIEAPFILISGKIGEERAAGMMRSGANDYIMKDNLSRLVPAIKREIHDYKLRKELRKKADEEKEEIKQLRKKLLAQEEEITQLKKLLVKQKAITEEYSAEEIISRFAEFEEHAIYFVKDKEPKVETCIAELSEGEAGEPNEKLLRQFRHFSNHLGDFVLRLNRLRDEIKSSAKPPVAQLASWHGMLMELLERKTQLKREWNQLLAWKK